jgi:hypothetical protein
MKFYAYLYAFLYGSMGPQHCVCVVDVHKITTDIYTDTQCFTDQWGQYLTCHTDRVTTSHMSSWICCFLKPCPHLGVFFVGGRCFSARVFPPVSDPYIFIATVHTSEFFLMAARWQIWELLPLINLRSMDRKLVESALQINKKCTNRILKSTRFWVFNN